MKTIMGIILGLLLFLSIGSLLLLRIDLFLIGIMLTVLIYILSKNSIKDKDKNVQSIQ